MEQDLLCIFVILLGCLAVYFHHGCGVTGLISIGLLLFIIASLYGTVVIHDYLKNKEVKKELIILNENIINNKPNLNDGLSLIEDPPQLSKINNKQKLVSLQNVNLYTCKVIKNNLSLNVNNKYKIKEIIINENNNNLCESGDENKIQYVLEIN